jgi:hypothetical protein
MGAIQRKVPKYLQKNHRNIKSRNRRETFPKKKTMFNTLKV